MALLKICQRCNTNIIDYADKYCNECSNKVTDDKKENNRNYNKNIRQVRDKQYTDFYVSKEWKMTAGIIRSRYKGLCLVCLLKENKINSYDVIHHVLEIKTNEGWNDRCNTDGLVPLCHSCHNELHGDYGTKEIEMLRELIEEYKRIYENM